MTPLSGYNFTFNCQPGQANEAVYLRKRYRELLRKMIQNQPDKITSSSLVHGTDSFLLWGHFDCLSPQ